MQRVFQQLVPGSRRRGVTPLPIPRYQTLSILAVATLPATFLLRVLGQAVQRWFPQEFLPEFEAWQGSGLPYPALLACQIVILSILGVAICTMLHHVQVLGPRASRWVIVAGWAYFALILTRLVLGLTAQGDSGWFTAWISTLLHLDLAAIVVLWGCNQLRQSLITAS